MLEDITEITDGTEKLLSKISEMESEIKKLKSENEQLKKYLKETNNLKLEIKRLKEENQRYRNIIAKQNKELNKLPSSLKNTNKKFTQFIFVSGYNDYNGLGSKPNNKNGKGCPIISPPVKLSFDPSSLLSYSAYNDHSVLVMSDGSLKGVGNNKDGQISSTLQKTEIKNFTDFCIKDRSGRQLAAISAVCYGDGALHVFKKQR